MSSKNNKRNPYADMGLMIAVSILIIMSINCLLFDASWESLIWILSAIAYCFVSYKFDSRSKMVRNSTTALLAISACLLFVVIFVDRKAQPKMHAFEGAKNDTIPEEVFILKKEPEIVQIIEDTTEVVDTLLDMENNPEEVMPSEEKETDTQTDAEGYESEEPALD